VKVTVKLAHEITNRITVVVGCIDLALGEIGKPKAVTLALGKAKAAALAVAKLVKEQTVKTVDNCEECPHRSTTLETKREKK
jgi:hypothetical protein